VGGSTPTRRFEVYATAERQLDADDLNYLDAKGCFALPEQSEELLEAYFKHVHPAFPIINVSDFSQKYAEHGLQGINLLLLWSMFSVSASYIQGTSRIANKELYVGRAKLLFEISQEHDKLVLVQSALLLSFWFADTEDVKQSWYWTSIAFGIAQSLGLHAPPERLHGQDYSEARAGLITWQCCIMRDVWLAFGMGRPLRAIVPDSAMCSGKLDLRLTDLTFKGRTLYTADEASALQNMWRSLVDTTNLLRNIMTSKTVPALNKVFPHSFADVPNPGGSALITHVSRHLELHQYTTAIALARAKNEQKELQIAIDGVIAITKTMIDDGTVTLASPVTVPLITPAMIGCLETARPNDDLGEDPEKSKLIDSRLDAISNFLLALEGNYPAASILGRVLRTARDEIRTASAQAMTRA
jgi:hypothetical protein